MQHVVELSFKDSIQWQESSVVACFPACESKNYEILLYLFDLAIHGSFSWHLRWDRALEKKDRHFEGDRDVDRSCNRKQCSHSPPTAKKIDVPLKKDFIQQWIVEVYFNTYAEKGYNTPLKPV